MVGVGEIPLEDMNSAIEAESGDGTGGPSFRRMPKVIAEDDKGGGLGNTGEVWLLTGDATISLGMSSQSSESTTVSYATILEYACNVESGRFSCEDGVSTSSLYGFGVPIGGT
jgi:hypothetical protein